MSSVILYIYTILSTIILPLLFFIYSYSFFQTPSVRAQWVLFGLTLLLVTVQFVLLEYLYNDSSEPFYSNLGDVGCAMKLLGPQPDISSTNQKDTEEIKIVDDIPIRKVAPAANILVCPTCESGTVGGRKLYFEYTPDSDRFVTSETCKACMA